jgi:hypothetical protein
MGAAFLHAGVSMTGRLVRPGLRRRRAISAALVCGVIVSLVPTTHLAGAATSTTSLVGVSCKSANLCVAVGFVDSYPAPRQPFIEMWNGTAWTQTASPSVPGGYLVSATCTSATDCVAVGQRGVPAKTLAEHWNGIRWTVTPTPSPAVEAMLKSVACVNAKFCFAVGESTNRQSERTLVARWNGTTWKQVASPNFPKTGIPASWLDGVSCLSVTNCFAVGSAFDGAVADDAFVVRWNGRVWSISARKDPTGDLNWLHSVSCAAKNMCLTVGEDNTGSPSRMLKGKWNGKVWRVAASPPSDRELVLESVSCASNTACLAVGSLSREAPYAERWNRGKWSPVPAPIPSGVGGFSSVACVRPGACYAVGASTMQYWNGSTWSVVTDAR